MPRQSLLNLLRQHVPADASEQTMTDATIAFVEQHPDCFERSLLVGESTAPGEVRLSDRPGHITGSAWVVSPDRSYVVLIHHRKLDRWLQPGGHADGDPDVAAVALREAREETGLASLRLVGVDGKQPAVFDVDIHAIPARGDVPEHRHYDIRFLLEADPNEPFGASKEVKDIRWFSMEDAKTVSDSESMLRMVRKTG